MNSAPTFLARGTVGGGGKEQETGGNAPSSMVQSSTVKHLQLLRSDFLLLPLLVLLVKPPKRGAPGVPGVAGVEGISSLLSIPHKER